MSYPNNLKDPNLFDKQWVVLPDGTLGVIDHVKPDKENVAVRPVNVETLSYYPNKSSHWTDEQKAHIPHEIVVHRDAIRPAPEVAIPRKPDYVS